MRPLAPLESEPFVNIAVDGFDTAVVSTPSGATAPKPVVVVAHGRGDRPDWQCLMWRQVVGTRGFVLCPRGRPYRVDVPQPGYAFHGADGLFQEIESALRALRVRFGEYVDSGPSVFAGFSQGAGLGAELVAAHGGQFPRAILMEGGWSHWDAAAARRFAADGGARVLLLCGQAACESEAQDARKALNAAQVECRVASDITVGHTYVGGMQKLLLKEFGWAIEGDRRW